MKIKGPNEVAPVRRSTEAPQSKQTEIKDRVSAKAAAELQTVLREAQSSAAGDRAARIAALTEQVRAGTFRPDPQRLAQEMLWAAELSARVQALLKR